MIKIKFDTEILQFMSLFEKITHVAAKDCFLDKSGVMVIIVPEEEIARAVGKQGVNARKLQTATNRKVKIVAFNPDLKTFIKNVVHPVPLRSIDEAEGVITLTAKDHQSRGLLIGRNAQNLRNFESIVKRYFEIKEMKVA